MGDIAHKWDRAIIIRMKKDPKPWREWTAREMADALGAPISSIASALFYMSREDTLVWKRSKGTSTDLYRLHPKTVEMTMMEFNKIYEIPSEPDDPRIIEILTLAKQAIVSSEQAIAHSKESSRLVFEAIKKMTELLK